MDDYFIVVKDINGKKAAMPCTSPTNEIYLSDFVKYAEHFIVAKDIMSRNVAILVTNPKETPASGCTSTPARIYQDGKIFDKDTEENKPIINAKDIKNRKLGVRVQVPADFTYLRGEASGAQQWATARADINGTDWPTPTRSFQTRTGPYPAPTALILGGSSNTYIDRSVFKFDALDSDYWEVTYNFSNDFASAKDVYILVNDTRPETGNDVLSWDILHTINLPASPVSTIDTFILEPPSRHIYYYAVVHKDDYDNSYPASNQASHLTFNTIRWAEEPTASSSS
jgi:hypothetical protein